MPRDPFKSPRLVVDRLVVDRLARSLHAKNDVGALEGVDVFDHRSLKLSLFSQVLKCCYLG